MLDALLAKRHPPSQPARSEALLLPDETQPDSHPVIFDAIDGLAIQKSVLVCTGSAGPSGLDAPAWRHMCIAFKNHQLTFVAH